MVQSEWQSGSSLTRGCEPGLVVHSLARWLQACSVLLRGCVEHYLAHSFEHCSCDPARPWAAILLNFFKNSLTPVSHTTTMITY
jgi:hypothetical protein